MGIPTCNLCDFHASKPFDRVWQEVITASSMSQSAKITPAYAKQKLQGTCQRALSVECKCSSWWCRCKLCFAGVVPAPAVCLFLMCSNCQGILCSTMYTSNAFSYESVYCFRAASVVCVSMTKLTVFTATPSYHHVVTCGPGITLACKADQTTARRFGYSAYSAGQVSVSFRSQRP